MRVAVQAAISAARLPIVLAGSCDAAIGVVAGMGRGRCGIVWIDAHADFNTPASSARAAPHRCRWRSAWTPWPRSSWTGCRTGGRAGRWGSPRPRWATAWTCCLVPWPRWGSASPTGPSSPAWTTCVRCWWRWPHRARRSWWTGCRPGATTPWVGQPEGAVRRQAPQPHRPGPVGCHDLG
ncbi:MAG TPA: arginase family protein [Actinomycetes bacterium]|nr:arginase family protein [Actinomycetes bacterium]